MHAHTPELWVEGKLRALTETREWNDEAISTNEFQSKSKTATDDHGEEDTIESIERVLALSDDDLLRSGSTGSLVRA